MTSRRTLCCSTDGPCAKVGREYRPTRDSNGLGVTRAPGSFVSCDGSMFRPEHDHPGVCCIYYREDVPNGKRSGPHRSHRGRAPFVTRKKDLCCCQLLDGLLSSGPLRTPELKSRRDPDPPVHGLLNSDGNTRWAIHAKVVRSGPPRMDTSLCCTPRRMAGCAYCFPIDPRDDQHVQAHKKYEVKGRAGHEAFMVADTTGHGTVLAALAKEAVPGWMTSSRNGRWGLSGIVRARRRASDPEARLMGIVSTDAGPPRHISSTTSRPTSRGVPRLRRVSLPLLGATAPGRAWAFWFGPPYAFRWGYGYRWGGWRLVRGRPPRLRVQTRFTVSGGSGLPSRHAGPGLLGRRYANVTFMLPDGEAVTCPAPRALRSSPRCAHPGSPTREAIPIVASADDHGAGPIARSARRRIGPRRFRRTACAAPSASGRSRKDLLRESAGASADLGGIPRRWPDGSAATGATFLLLKHELDVFLEPEHAVVLDSVAPGAIVLYGVATDFLRPAHPRKGSWAAAPQRSSSFVTGRRLEPSMPPGAMP